MSATAAQFINPTVLRLTERNARAERIIRDYAKKHAGMDILIGFSSLIPGLAAPALVGAIAAQGPLIYRPMADDLGALYMADCDALNEDLAVWLVNAISAEDLVDIKKLVGVEIVHTGVLDATSEFGQEFMMQIGHELVMEAGAGVIASLCVPVLGGVVGAALDYLIANIMTWRVGTMVSMYYQNNAQWLGTRQATFERAKQLTGGIKESVSDVLNQKEHQTFRVDLDSLRSRIPAIAEAQVRALKSVVDMMRSAMSDEQIRAALKGQGIPVDVIDKAIKRYGKGHAGS